MKLWRSVWHGLSFIFGKVDMSIIPGPQNRRSWAIVDWAFLRSDQILEDRAVFARCTGQAADVSAPDRIVFSVLERDRPWWEHELESYPTENIIEQPIDRGSVPGVLLSAMSIASREPSAEVHLFGRVTGRLGVQELVAACEGQSPALYRKVTSMTPSDPVNVPTTTLDLIYPFLDREDLDVAPQAARTRLSL